MQQWIIMDAIKRQPTASHGRGQDVRMMMVIPWWCSRTFYRTILLKFVYTMTSIVKSMV